MSEFFVISGKKRER